MPFSICCVLIREETLFSAEISVINLMNYLVLALTTKQEGKPGLSGSIGK